MQGGDEFIKAIERLTSRVAQAAQKATEQASLELESRARRNASRRPGPMVRTGTLRRGIRAHPVIRVGDVFIGRVGVSVLYGRIQELGGVIRPRRAKMLSWVGPDGKRRYARQVRIPARPYFRPAYVDTRARFRSIAADHVGTAIRA